MGARMLILTRRIGETIYIGDDICITVYDKLRYHVSMGVITPVNTKVLYGDTCLRPAVLPDGERFYLISLLTMDEFQVGDTVVRVSFNPSYLGEVSPLKRQIRVGIDAPQSTTVLREEVYHRQLVKDGKRVPPISFATWLRQANLSVSSRTAA
jgi:sRNA-binding carbon storage regulator CsrA